MYPNIDFAAIDSAQSLERDPGATWAFTVIADRIPIGAAVLLIYFGAGRTSTWLGTVLLGLLGLIVIVTSPVRWSIAIALHYLSRVYWPDEDDPLPPASAPGSPPSQHDRVR